MWTVVITSAIKVIGVVIAKKIVIESYSYAGMVLSLRLHIFLWLKAKHSFIFFGT